MPELPEVEIVRRTLEPLVINNKIKEVIVLHRPIVNNDATFETKLVNQTIHKIDRIGKFLIFILDDYALVSHLRMEGKYKYYPTNDKYGKHEHVIFKFTNGYDLIYNDTRKFGRFEILPLDYNNYLPFTNLAPEPYTISPDFLYQKVKNKTISIKEALLDQHIIAGLGNIYVNEVLFMAKIHPSMPSYLITYQNVLDIISHSIVILDKATQLGGSTVSSYQSINGIHGMFQNELQIYGKDKQPCINCGSIIYKYQLKGRGTYACPECQKQYTIGITGGVASGKTTVVNYLSDKGYYVINSDQIVRDIYQNPYHINQINQLFNLKGETNQIDRKQLAQKVFNNPKLLAKLNNYVHPLVFELIEKQKHSSGCYFVFIEMPLLFETGYQSKVNETILIDISTENQLKRIVKRDNILTDEAAKIIQNQMGSNEKQKLADNIIDNNGSIVDLIYQVDQYLKLKFRGRK